MPEPSDADQPAAPSRWLGDVGAFDPGRRGVKVLAVVAVVVVLGAAAWAWRSRPRAEPVTTVPAAPTGEVVAPGTTSATAEVVVAVAGKVRRPGLVRLPVGARVADAVEAAGGALPDVDTAMLNLARKVNDGELILVGVTPPPGAPGTHGDPAAAGGKVNLNTATQAQLETLPGVGPVLAQRILAYRERHGGFRSVADLRRVDGIGDARFEQLKDLVTV
ncbi:MAG TPA: ComEA family DNA-binding protein [Natronosporangium sp.]